MRSPSTITSPMLMPRRNPIRAVRWQLRVPGPEGLLDPDRGLHGVHDARELGQEVVACGVHDPAPVLPDERAHDLAAGREGADGGDLVRLRQAAVALRVGAQDRGQLPPDARGFDRGSPGRFARPDLARYGDLPPLTVTS
jgi:hypothetical protein